MLSQLLDVLDEQKDADRLDALLDKNEDLFFNLILYYYSPKPEAKQISNSSSNASSSSSSPPLPLHTEYTLQEKTLCGQIAKFTTMHESHIINSYSELKSISIDSFAMNEIQVWNHVFEERQRMFNCLISMLNFVISNEEPASNFANSISNHINLWIHNGWKRKIVDCYIKLTQHTMPQHLPQHLIPKYCQFIAEEQLLLWKMVFLLYYEPIVAELEDIDIFFELYPLSLKKAIQIYINNSYRSCDNECAVKINQIMKQMDDLLIAVFMELLPIQSVHGYVEEFQFLLSDKHEIDKIKMNYKLARPQNIPKIQKKLENAFKKSRSNTNNHLRNIWKIYSDIGNKLVKLLKLIDSQQNNNSDNINIYHEIDKINETSTDETATDAVTRSNLISCFEKILITFGDCDDSAIFIKPIQCSIKYYIDAILLKDPQVLVDSDNIHFIYQHILSDNPLLCREFFDEKGKLERFALYKYAWKSFQTQPYLMLGFLSSLCSDRYCAQKVYEIFSSNSPYYTIKQQIDEYITAKSGNIDKYISRETFEWNYIMINRGAIGTVCKGRDGMTDIISWGIEWNGFLWLLSLLTHCMNEGMNEKGMNMDTMSSISKHNIAYMSYNTLPSAMQLLTKLTRYYPEAISLINDDIKLINKNNSRQQFQQHFISSISSKKYIESHSKKLFRSIMSGGGINLMSFKLFIHCMDRLKKYDYDSHSMSNALNSTKDGYDWNLDLFCDSTEFFKFITNQSIERMIKILYSFDRNNNEEFFCRIIINVMEVLTVVIHNSTKNIYGDDLAFEKSQYQLKCIWNIIGYLIDIINKIFINKDITYFQEWNLEIFQYIQTLFRFYPMFYPMTSFQIEYKTTLHSYSIRLHCKATELITNITKYDQSQQSVFIQMIIDKFCNDEGFRNFIIDPIVYSNEILNYLRSSIRHNDERLVNRITCDSMKILMNILIHLNIDQRQEIIIKISHKLNPNQNTFEQISLADKICQILIQQSQKYQNLNLINECINFLKFLCSIFPPNSPYPFQNLFTSITEIQRLSHWMTKYLNINKWRKPSDIKRAINLIDLLCIFMSNQNRLRHILLKQEANNLFLLLIEIIKNDEALNKYAHITAKCLEIFWLLHSDLDPVIYPYLNNNTIWDAISNILSSDLQNITHFISPSMDNDEMEEKFTNNSSVVMGKKIDNEYTNRCWQNECYCWCFNILLQEIEQTLSFFDEIDSKYTNRRKKINKLIRHLAIDQKLLIKWMKIMVNIPAINVDLLKKRENISIDFRINLNEFQSDSLRLHGDYKYYGRNCIDKYKKLITKLKLLSKSADLAKAEENIKNRNININREKQSGQKRSYLNISYLNIDEQQIVPRRLPNIRYCLEVIEQFNLLSSLVFSHRLMLSSWTGLITHICLCSPHILGLLPITCYNKKLSQTHLDATINKIKQMTQQSVNKGNMIYVSPTKTEINQEESIKQLFHWNILRSLPRPKRQSKLTSIFIVELSKMLNIAFKYMMDPEYYNSNKMKMKMKMDIDNDEKQDIDIQYVTLEGMLNSKDLENHLFGYIEICQVLRDVINHLTQDLDENNNINANVLTFDLSKQIFINIAECIQIASEFGYNISKTTQFQSPKRRKLLNEMDRSQNIDIIIELLLMVSMVIIKWMLHYGPKLDIDSDKTTSFQSTMKKKRPHFSKWSDSMPATTPIKKKLGFENYDEKDDLSEADENNSDNDVINDPNYSPIPQEINCSNLNRSTMSTTSQSTTSSVSHGLSVKNPWFDAIRGCLMILKILSSTSSHLIIDRNDSNIAVSIFPYLIECIPFNNLSLQFIKQYGFIKYCINHFSSISNNVVNQFVNKQKNFEMIDREYNYITNKLFQTKSDQQRLIELNNIKIVTSKEYIVKQFIPSIEKLSSILQCFESIAQESLNGAILLFECELLYNLTNCSIFKSNDAQFLDPYLIDNGEENPCHELWCKTLEIITYLLRQTALALNTKSIHHHQQHHDLMSNFIRNIMKFCAVHHDRILNKIQYISNPNSYLRLRDLEEINIISSFIYEIEKNALLISQQSLDTKTEFKLHRQRFYGLLQIITKFIIILESPEMLSSLTPPISTHEKYAFGYHQNKKIIINEDDTISSSSNINQQQQNIDNLTMQRQRSRHIQWAEGVKSGSSNNLSLPTTPTPTPTLSVSDDSRDGNDGNNISIPPSPLPLGKLLKGSAKSTSVDTNIGDDDDDAMLRRDQFLQRIEYYILDILKNILFCCRYEILDNWNHRNMATYLFTPDLKQLHFLSTSNINNKTQPSLSVLVRLCHYAITHLKGLYQTQKDYIETITDDGTDDDDGTDGGILKRKTNKNNKQKKKSFKKKRRGRDYMYDSKKVESEGMYHIVTWKNIEKTLWILFEHCYINLLLQIDCFLKSNEQLILQYIIPYRNCLDKLWKRISRFELFLKDNKIIQDGIDCNIDSYANNEMKFIHILQLKQHHQLIMNIEKLRNKYMPNISIQRQQSDQTQLSLRSHPTSDTMTDITGATRRHRNISTINTPYTTNTNLSNYYSPYTINTNRSRIIPTTTSSRHHFTRNTSAASNVSSSWA